LSSNAVTRSHVFYIALPIILSNLSTPLLGLVDTAVIGNLGNPALIGAIAVGGMIFSFLFWGFGFLRMGTTGLVAQALGAGNQSEARAAFYRAFIVGASIGFLLLIFQLPIIAFGLSIIDASEQVETAALTYFQIRIWGAPLSLAHLAILGYLLGQQDTRSILIIQLLLNITNIILDFVFVVGLDLEVAGAAAATVLAECLALIVGLSIVLRKMKGSSLLIPSSQLIDTMALKRMFVVNRDIMIRTICLIFAFAWFTNEGAKSGDILLATNAILMQFVSFSAFFLDGFALAAESLVGNAVGARNKQQLKLSIIYSTQLSFMTAILVSTSFLIIGTTVIEILTNVREVRDAAATYLPWAIAAPVISIWCYLLDGIFIGATRTPEMRNAMIISLAAYLMGWWILADAFGNHGLWASLMIYFVARAASLSWYLPRLIRSL
jgi:multidrug resistance protein, MATE family